MWKYVIHGALEKSKYVQIQQQQQQQQHTNHDNKLQEYNERTLVFEVNMQFYIATLTMWERKKKKSAMPSGIALSLYIFIYYWFFF